MNPAKETREYETLNSDLKKIVVNLNNRFSSKNWYVIVLGIIIVFSGVWQEFSKNQNPFWTYTQVPIVILFGLVLFYFFKTYRKLTVNVKMAESQILI